jgi:hypothetical protein
MQEKYFYYMVKQVFRWNTSTAVVYFRNKLSDQTTYLNYVKPGRAGHVARMGEKRNENRISVGKSEGKRPLGRPRRRWEDGIRMDLREIGWGGLDWIDLAQDRDQWRALVNMVINLQVP